MIPAHRRLTEAEYWHDFDIIRNDVSAAMVSCYTHRTVNDAAADDQEIAICMNRTPDFWRVILFSLQNTLFIVLARILDDDGKVHSIHRVLNATTANPQFFNREALRARKLSLGAPRDMAFLDSYIANAWEPTIQDLRALKKALAPHKAKFDAIYRAIRNQIAHIDLRDEAAITALYGRTLKTDIDAMLCFLFNLIRAIQEIAHNGRRPDLSGDNYGYSCRVEEITKETKGILRSLLQ